MVLLRYKRRLRHQCLHSNNVRFTSYDNRFPTPPIVTSSKSSTPIGPILGGVLGGVALIVLLTIAVVYLLTARSRSSRTHLSQQYQATVEKKELPQHSQVFSDAYPIQELGPGEQAHELGTGDKHGLARVHELGTRVYTGSPVEMNAYPSIHGDQAYEYERRLVEDVVQGTQSKSR